MSYSTNGSSRKRDASHLNAEAAQQGAQTPTSPKRQRVSERGEDAKVNAAWEQQQALASAQSNSSSNNSANAGTRALMQAIVVQSIHSIEADTPVGTVGPLMPAALTAPIFSLTTSGEGDSTAGASQTADVTISSQSAVMMGTAYAATRGLSPMTLNLQTPTDSGSSNSGLAPLARPASLFTPQSLNLPLALNLGRSLSQASDAGSSTAGVVIDYEDEGMTRLNNQNYNEASRFFTMGINSSAYRGDHAKRASLYNHLALAQLRDLGFHLLHRNDLEFFRKSPPHGDFNNAIDNLQRALNLEFDDDSLKLQIRFNLAMAYAFRGEQGDQNLAVETLDAAVHSVENQVLSPAQQLFMARLLHEFGLIFEGANKMQDALRCYEYAEDLCSHLENEDPDRYNLHARLLVDLGIFLIDSDTLKAFACLEKARGFQEKIGNRRTVADLLLNLGLVCEKQGNNNQAMIHYENAVKVDCDDPDLFGLISFNCSRLSVEFRRNLDVSIGIAEQALMRDIQDQALVADLHWLVMTQLHKRGRSGDIFAAIAKGNHALDLPFQNAQIRTKLLATQAQLYLQVHNKKEAARHFKLAAGIEENSAALKYDFFFRAAALHSGLLNYKAAINCLKGAELVAHECSPVAFAKLCLDLANLHLSAADKSEDNEESAHLAREARFYLLKGLKIEQDDAAVKEKLAEQLGFHFFWENGIEALGTQEERANVGKLLASGSDVQKVEALRIVAQILVDKKKDFSRALRVIADARMTMINIFEQQLAAQMKEENASANGKIQAAELQKAAALKANETYPGFIALMAYFAAHAHHEIYKTSKNESNFDLGVKETQSGLSLSKDEYMRARFLNLQAQLFEDAGDMTSAEKSLREACQVWKTVDRFRLDLLENLTHLLVRAARGFERTQDYANATAKLKEAIKATPDYDLRRTISLRLAAVYTTAKEYQQAVNVYATQIIANEGGNVHLAEVRAKNAAILHQHGGDINHAYKLLKEADALIGINANQLGAKALEVRAEIDRLLPLVSQQVESESISASLSLLAALRSTPAAQPQEESPGVMQADSAI